MLKIKNINPELLEWLKPILDQYIPKTRNKEAIKHIQRIKEILFIKSKLDKDTKCINYINENKIKVYPVFTYSNHIKGMYTHQLSWLLYNKDILKPNFVLHTCDNKFCINPKHLYKGTHQDNVKDRIRIGRKNKLSINSKQGRFIKMQILVQYYGMKIKNRASLAGYFDINYLRVLKIINENKNFVYDPIIHEKYLLKGEIK